MVTDVPDHENERLAKMEERLKSDFQRLERLERLAEEVNIQNENMAKLVVELEYANRQLTSHEKRIAKMESLPGQGMRRLIGAVITAIVSAVIGGLFASLF